MNSSRTSLPKVTVRGLSEQVVEALRDAIIKEELQPGHHLVESEIAQQMGVSRGPVREAIRLLDQEGLVELFRHRGAIVVGMSDVELDAVYEMRATIEAFAFAQAADIATPDDLRMLEGLIAEIEKFQDQRLIPELVDADVEFHAAVMRMSGYGFLKRRWDALDGIIRVRSIQALERPGPVAEHFLASSVDSHRALLDAVAGGDRQAAADAARGHIREATGLSRQA